MKTNPLLLIISTCFIQNGCSKDYNPSAKATGESIYQTACIQCHKKTPEGLIFTFNREKYNVNYISKRISDGRLMMPKFPNIKGRQLQQLSDYILNNSGVQ